MEKFKNITHYHNFQSKNLNFIEEFFTQFVIDFLTEIPENLEKKFFFEILDIGNMEVSKSFKIDNNKWAGVTVEISLRYIASIKPLDFCDFCRVRVIVLKQNWWEITDDEDDVSFRFGDFPTDLLPDKIIAMFEPVFSMPEKFEKLASLYKYKSALRSAFNYVEDRNQLWEMIENTETKIKELKSITSNFPIEEYFQLLKEKDSKSISEKEYEEALVVVNGFLSQIQGENISKEYAQNMQKHSALMGIKKSDLLIDVASVRLLNILSINSQHLNIEVRQLTKVEELTKISLAKFKTCRNTGFKTLWELKAIAYYSGIKLQEDEN